MKILATGEKDVRKFSSHADMTAQEMVEGVKAFSTGWKYQCVSIGYPGLARGNQVVAEPRNLGAGWVEFDFEGAFGCPVQLINDAALQALGSYRGPKLLFLGLGTGLGSAMVADGILLPMELAHLPYKKGTYEQYVGAEALERRGKKKWRRDVAIILERLTAALQPEEIVIGGGNVTLIKDFPPHCRAGDNFNAFLGGFSLWPLNSSPRRKTTVSQRPGRTSRSSKKRT